MSELRTGRTSEQGDAVASRSQELCGRHTHNKGSGSRQSSRRFNEHFTKIHLLRSIKFASGLDYRLPASRCWLQTLCARFSAWRRECAEERRAELLNKLKAVLYETPAPAALEVYMRLGITESIAIHSFPELRRAIIVRYRQFRHQQSCALQKTAREESERSSKHLTTRACALRLCAYGA